MTIKLILKQTLKYALIGLSIIVTTSCLDGKNDGLDSSGYIVPSPSTIVLNQSTLESIKSISANGKILFSTIPDQLINVTPGDILVSGSNNLVPQGSLRTVKNVEIINGIMSIDTMVVSLEESIEDGDITSSKELSKSEISSFETNFDEVSIEGFNIDVNGEWTPEAIIMKVNNLVVFDRDKNPDTTNDQIKLNGSIEVKPSFLLGLQIGWFRVKEFKFLNTTKETSNLQITTGKGIGGEFSFQKTIDLGSILFKTFNITENAFPIPVTPSLKVRVEIFADGYVKVDTSMKQELVFNAGVEYVDKNWNRINNSTFKYTLDNASIGPDARFNMKLGGELSVLLFGMAGPKIRILPFVELNTSAAITGSLYLETYTKDFKTSLKEFNHELGGNLAWDLYSGVSIYLGIIVEILSNQIIDYEKNIYDYAVIFDGDINTDFNTPIDCHVECHEEKTGCNTEQICETICQ